jgi:hypothetical protein
MTQVNEAQNTATETIEELERRVQLHAKTRALNKTLSPALERAEADAIAKLEAAKAAR